MHFRVRGSATGRKIHAYIIIPERWRLPDENFSLNAAFIFLYFAPATTMSESNQKSIASFFQAPKRSRPPESPLETIDNRSSKSTRISVPNLSDMELDDLGINEDIQTIEVEDETFNSIDEDESSHLYESIDTTSLLSTQKSKPGRVYLWKDEYLELFKWLKYDSSRKIAWCSYSSCKMYEIFLIIIIIH